MREYKNVRKIWRRSLRQIIPSFIRPASLIMPYSTADHG
jgi:hypothetical protein